MHRNFKDFKSESQSGESESPQRKQLYRDCPFPTDRFAPPLYSSPLINNKFKDKLNPNDSSWINNNRRSGSFRFNNHHKSFSRNHNTSNRSDISEKNFNKMDIIHSYFHRSMLEDPWKDLMQRYSKTNTSTNDLTK